MTAPVRVGLIEDNPGDVRLVQELLSEPSAYPIALHTSGRLDQGLARLAADDSALLLLDLGLPDSNGLATYYRVRDSAPALPVIIFSGAADEELAATAVSHGAQDYLVKGQVDGFHLRRSIRYAIERKRMGELLRQQQNDLKGNEELFRLLLESTTEGIFGVDTDGTCTFCNPIAATLLGYSSPNDVTGLPMHHVVHGGHAAGQPHRLEECEFHQAWLTGSGFHSPETRFWRADGRTFNAAVHVSPLMGTGNQVGSVVTFTDVTEQQALEAQLRQAQKMELVGQLAGGVAHDFNNMLCVILGWTAMSLAESSPGNPLREALEEIRNAGEAASDLTRQLLAFSRKQLVEPTIVDLNELVTSADKMLRRLIGEQIEWKSRVNADIGAVKIDRGQLEQILMNLVVNARDAMPKGGEITIETANVLVGGQSPHVVPDVAPGEYVVLVVTDTGTGMNEAVRARIFEPFFTTKERDKGTGLGLATCYGITRQAGGNIVASSEEGVGTTMQVYLPRCDGTPAVRRSPAGAPSRGVETILLVEDEPAVRRVTTRMLEAQGYRVVSAASGTEALRIIEGAGKLIDLLLTDVVLKGGMNGATLAERVRAQRPSQRILFASGYTSDVSIVHGLLESGVALAHKPFTAESLGDKVREVLDAK